MAFTKVLGPGIHTLSNITSHNINSSGIITAVSFVGDGSSLTGIANTDFIVGTAITMGTGNFTGDLTVGGVLTYEDVKNVDSIGVVTARNGIECNSDISIISTGDANLNLVADTGNNNEASVPTINFTQDGGVNVMKIGVEGNNGDTFTGSTGNTPYILTTTGHGGMPLDFAVGGGLRMKLTATGLEPATNNVEYLGTNSKRWGRLYTNGIYDANIKRFGVTSTGFEGYGTQFKFSDVGDCNVIINADTDNYDESHTPNLAFTQDGSTNVLNVGVEGVSGDQFTGSTANFAYVQVGGHNAVGLEIATGNTSTKRLTIDTNGHIIPAADSTYNIGSNSVRFANVYADNLYGTLNTSTITSAVTIDVDGNDNGETTLFTLDNYVSDLSNEYTWIDFTFRDSNANSTPQVKIGAQVADDSGTGTQGEGAGDFVVKCAVDTASNTMTEMFRCSHDTKITSVHHHPQSDSNFDLGTNTVRWRNVYADTLYGNGSNLTGIDTDLVSDTSPQLGGNLDVNSKSINFGDSNGSTTNIAKFGASGDLVIYHNGNHSKIIDMGTGNLYLESDVGSIYLRVSDNEQGVTIHQDGAVELYHNNTKTFQTTSFGAETIFTSASGTTSIFKVLHGNLSQGVGVGYHSIHATGSNASVQLKLMSKGSYDVSIQTSAGENMAIFRPNESVYLYYDNSQKFKTTSSGATLTGSLTVTDDIYLSDANVAYFGTNNDMRVYHSGTHGYIKNTVGNLYFMTTNSEYGALLYANGAAELRYDNVKKFETTSSGVQVTGALNVTTTMHIPDGSVGLQFGNSNDMIMYHNGSNSFIQHQGTGDLYIDSLNNSADIYIRSRDNLHLRTNQNAQESVVCVGNGGVILYNAGSQKFTTNANGIAVTGRATFPDGNTNGVVIGDSGDVRLFHNGSHTYLENDTGNFVLDNSSGVDMYINSGNDIYIRPQGTEDGIKLIGNGAVELYHNGNRQVFTIDGGLNWQDNKKAEFGNSGDLKIYHDGSHTRMHHGGTGQFIIYGNDNDQVKLMKGSSEEGIILNNNGNVELYHNNTKRFETTSNGNRTNGELLYLGPNNVTNFVHSGGNLSLTADTNIYFVADCNDTSGVAPAGEFIWGAGSSTNTDSNQDFTAAEFGNSGAPRNYIMILDESSLRPANNNNLDLGGSNNRWKTIYTMDLELSNKGSSNSVDGTWGDWTLQEGENDIYMINNRTGKKFKIKMEAVD